MPQRMLCKEEKCFWLEQDVESGKVLELGIPPEDIQIEEVGKQVMLGLAIELVPDGPPLAPLMEVR